MAKPLLSALILLLLASSVSAIELNVLQYNKTRHLGDQIVSRWVEAPYNEGLNYTGVFYLEARPPRAWAEMYIHQTDTNDLILVNDVALSHPPLNEDWQFYNVTIPPEFLHSGYNTFTISTEIVSGTNWDDILIRNLTVKVYYSGLEPSIIATKSLSKYAAIVGEPVNITLTLLNEGIRAAHNLSVSDYLPNGTYLLRGEPVNGTRTLYGGEMLTMGYSVLAAEPGLMRSPAGMITFYDTNMTLHNLTIEPTELSIRPYLPRLLVLKNTSSETVGIGSTAVISILLNNNGTSDLYNISVRDDLPENLPLASGSNNATIPRLGVGMNETINYTISPTAAAIYSLAAEISFQDASGFTYNKTSNYVNLTATNAPAISKTQNQGPLLAGIGALIIILAYVYLRIRR